MYKTMNELELEYLQCLFSQRHVSDYNIRNLEGKRSLPKPLITSNEAFVITGIICGITCPQNAGFIGQFKRGIKKLYDISDFHTAIM